MTSREKTTAFQANQYFHGSWDEVAAYIDHQAANWLEEHTERIRLEERLKIAVAPVVEWIWTPVIETLPPHGEYVIASDGKRVTEAAYFYYASKFDKHGWYRIDGMRLGCDWATHWMPKPQLPNQKEQGQ